MSEKEKDTLLESSYDGIQEYDNDLPRWWLNIFWLTTIFAIIYMVYVHGFRPVDSELLASELAELQAKKQAAQPPASSEEISEEYLLKLVSDESGIALGKEVYLAKCAACHGQAGEGLIGPNLTDAYWIHGGTLTDIRTTIQKGVLDKGMLAWEGVIPDSEINAVTAYIRKIHGTAPENPKAPQGELFEP